MSFNIKILPSDEKIQYKYKHTTINDKEKCVMYNYAEGNYYNCFSLQDDEYFVKFARKIKPKKDRNLKDKKHSYKEYFTPLVFEPVIKKYINFIEDGIIIDDKLYSIFQRNSYRKLSSHRYLYWLKSSNVSEYRLEESNVQGTDTQSVWKTDKCEKHFVRIICRKFCDKVKLSVENKPINEIKSGLPYNVQFLKRRFEIYDYGGSCQPIALSIVTGIPVKEIAQKLIEGGYKTKKTGGTKGEGIDIK